MHRLGQLRTTQQDATHLGLFSAFANLSGDSQVVNYGVKSWFFQSQHHRSTVVFGLFPLINVNFHHQQKHQRQTSLSQQSKLFLIFKVFLLIFTLFPTNCFLNIGSQTFFTWRVLNQISFLICILFVCLHFFSLPNLRFLHSKKFFLQNITLLWPNYRLMLNRIANRQHHWDHKLNLFVPCWWTLLLILQLALQADAFTNTVNLPSPSFSSSSSSSSLSAVAAGSGYPPQYHHDHHRHHTVQKQTEIGLNITRILNAFFDSGYDKRVRPNYAGPPVEVGVTMHIISISSISAVQMDFTSDFYFRQAWRDPRLSFVPRPGIEALFVGAEVSEKIWVPDTFFANEKSALMHMATTPNTFIRIKANGEVFRSMRLTITSSCPMKLQYFPMDRQKCTIEVESYGYSMADIQYKWGIDGKGSVELAENLELPQFKVKKHRQMQRVETLSTGNYSRLICEIEFVRSMGYYLIQIYIPASLIVIISWVSFWLHRNASPARVQLGVTTVLTMTTLMSSTNAAMPKISYIKSIDVFLGTCFVMVFAALLEYATVGYMGKRIAMRKTRTQQLVRMLNEHREKCYAAAAAAASATGDPKNGILVDDSTPPGGGHRAHHNTLIRTASLYPCLERMTCEEAHPTNKRDFRSSSSAGQCYHGSHHYGQHQSSQSSSRQPNNARMLERSVSLKSRIFSDCDDQEQSNMNQFNDDLSVFVPAASSGCATQVGGTSLGYTTGGHSSSQQSPHYYQPRHSGSDPCYHGSRYGQERTYMPSPNYVMKDHNTLFGVCPSDIDKYSRVVFPVCFLCFNLMYWIIYMHISEFLIDDATSNNTQLDESSL